MNNNNNKSNLESNLESTQKQNTTESNLETIQKPNNKKMTIINIILIAIIFIGLTIYMINVDGLDNIINLLKNVNYMWVFAGIICLIIFWICEALTLHIPLKTMYKNQKFLNSFKVSMIGQLFNNITPFSSGGQPMQAYELTKTGKRVSDSLSAMSMKFIITQIALVLFTFLVMLFQFDFLKNLMQGFLWLVIVSFVVNILAIALVILAGVNKNIIMTLCKPFIKLGRKLKIVKDIEKTTNKLDESVTNFNLQFKNMNSQKFTVIQVFIIATIQSILYYSLTYVVYRAFGNYGVSYFQIIPAQAFLLLIMTFIPTPGSGIGAEGGFLLIFNSIFKHGTINMAILFWRLYTFYLPIIVGALFLIPIKNRNQLHK